MAGETIQRNHYDLASLGKRNGRQKQKEGNKEEIFKPQCNCNPAFYLPANNVSFSQHFTIPERQYHDGQPCFVYAHPELRLIIDDHCGRLAPGSGRSASAYCASHRCYPGGAHSDCYGPENRGPGRQSDAGDARGERRDGFAGNSLATFRANEIKLLAEAQTKLDDLAHQIEQKRALNNSNAEKRVADLQQAQADLKKAEIPPQRDPF